MQYVASQSSSAGISFDKMIGLIAVGSETTRLSAETIGNTWKSVLARMEQVKAGAKIDEEGEAINNVEKVLNKFGIQLRSSNSEFRNMEDVLDEVGNKWSTFDSVAQAQIATAIAGTHRINTFVATMENYDTVLKYTEESQDAAGTSAQKYTAYMDSIDAKLNTLTATWEQFVNNLNQSGTFKSVIDLGTKLIGVLDTLINKMGLLKIALPAAAIMLVSTKLLQLVKYLQNLGNAANKVQAILKPLNSSADVSSELIQEISTSLAGLSVKQRLTLLSTTKLTNSQKEQILVASGLTTEEAAAAIATNTFGISAAGASGGVFSLSAAVKGLTAAIAANPIGIALTVITTAVSGIIWAVDAYNQKIQETIDKAHELEETYSNFTKESKSSINSLTDVKDEFERLSAGVSDYGENISLSTEDYKRYKEIVAQVLEYTPQLKEGYRKEGEAIANKNGLIEKSIELLREQQRLELRGFIAKDIPDIGKGLKNELKEAEKDFHQYSEQLQLRIQDILISEMTPSDTSALKTAFGLDIDSSLVDLEVLARTRTEDVYNYLIQNVKGLKKKYLAELQDLAEKQAIASVKIAQAQKAFNPSLQIVPQVVEGYSELDDSAKQFISNYIDQFKLADNQSKTTWTQWVQDIKDFTGIIIGLTPDIRNAISSIFTLDPSDLPVEEYKEQIENMLNTVLGAMEKSGVDKETMAKIKTSVMVQLGLVVVDENGNEIDTQQQMINALKKRYNFFAFMDTSDWTLGDFKLALAVEGDIKNAKDLTTAMQELNTAAQGTTPTFEEAQSAIASALDEFAITTQTVADNYDALKTAMDDFNNKGTISSKTLKELAKNDLVQYLSIVNGKIQINTQALSDNIEAAKKKAKLDVLQNGFNQLLALSEDRVTESAINSVDASATAATQVELMGQAFANATLGVTSVSEALKRYYYITKKKLPEQFSDQEQKIMQNVLDSVKLIDVVSDSTTGASNKSGSSSSESKKIKEQKQNVEDLIEAFIKMYKQELKERKEAENAGYEITKRRLEDEKTVMERRFRDVKQHYEDLNKAQEKGAEKRLDALEAEYDAYQKKIDAEKDLLKAKKEEEEYEKSLAEKTKDVAKIQSELAKLQFDDSIEAQKKRIELMEQLSEKQGDLDEFQNDHRYDTTEDALDKESNRYKDLYDERKKEIEDEKKAWKDLYDARIDALEREQTRWKDDFDNRKTSEQRAHEDRVNQIESEINDERKLRADAIAAIESRNEEAYNKLIEWNRLYGTGIDYDITQKWNIAKAALKEYGDQGLGLQKILDILAQKVDEISNKTSSAGSGFGGWYAGVDKTNTALDDTAEKLDKIKKTIHTLDDVDILLKGSEKGKNIPGITKNHTGTDYVAMNANDRLLNKSLGLKSDEVVRILKVGEAVIPKERNLKRLRENSDFVENSSLRRVSELSETSQGSISDNSSHVSISIGDTIVQGDADNNVVNRLNEYKKSLVNEVFSRINKHTNLSGFRSSKRYV